MNEYRTAFMQKNPMPRIQSMRLENVIRRISRVVSAAGLIVLEDLLAAGA